MIATVSAAGLYAAVHTWDPGLPLSADAWQEQVKFLAYAVLTALAMGILARSSLAGILLTVGLTALTMTQVPLSFAPTVDALRAARSPREHAK